MFWPAAAGAPTAAEVDVSDAVLVPAKRLLWGIIAVAADGVDVVVDAVAVDISVRRSSGARDRIKVELIYQGEKK